MSERARNRRTKRVIFAAAVTLALSACESEYEPLPEESTSQTPPPPSTAPCDKPAAATPYTIENDSESDAFKKELLGLTGLHDTQAAWLDVQQTAEENLQAKGVPPLARVKISVAVGTMLGNDQKNEAAGIELNAVGVGGEQSPGQLTDSVVYRFIRDEEDPKPDPGASLDSVTLTFTPEIKFVDCK
jgi:hypothetical protein